MKEKEIAIYFTEVLSEFEQKKDFISFTEKLSYNIYDGCNFEKLIKICEDLKIKIKIKNNTEIEVFNRKYFNI